MHIVFSKVLQSFLIKIQSYLKDSTENVKVLFKYLVGKSMSTYFE